MTTKPWQIVHEVFDSYVDEALVSQKKGKEHRLKDHQNVVETLVQQTDDRIEIRNQAIHAMLGAQNTLPVLLSNTLFCLSRHPDIWYRLRAEVASVGSDPLSIEETKHFRLLRNVLNECKYCCQPCPFNQGH